MTVTSILNSLLGEPDLWKLAASVYVITMLAIVTLRKARIWASVEKAQNEATRDILLAEQARLRDDAARKDEFQRMMFEAEVKRIGGEFPFAGEITHRPPPGLDGTSRKPRSMS